MNNLCRCLLYLSFFYFLSASQVLGQSIEDDLSIPSDQNGAPLYKMAIRNIAYLYDTSWYFSSIDGSNPLTVREATILASDVRIEYDENGNSKCISPYGFDELQLGYTLNSEPLVNNEAYASAQAFTAAQCLATFGSKGYALEQKCSNPDLTLFLDSYGVNGYCSEPVMLDCGNVAHGDTASRLRYASDTVPFGETCISEEQVSTCSDGIMSSWSGSYNFESCTILPEEHQDCGAIAHGDSDSRIRFASETVPFGEACTSEQQESTCSNGIMSSWSGSYNFESCTILPEEHQDCGAIAHGDSESRIRFASETVPFGETCSSEQQESTCSDGIMSSWSGSYNFESCTILPEEHLDCGAIAHGDSDSRIRFASETAPFGETCTSEQQVSTCSDGEMSSWSGSYNFESCTILPEEHLDCGDIAHGETQSRLRYAVESVPFGETCRSEQQSATCTDGDMSAWTGTYQFENCTIEQGNEDLSLLVDENSSPLYHLAIRSVNENSNNWYFASLNGIDPLSLAGAKQVNAEYYLEYAESGEAICTVIYGADYFRLAYVSNSEPVLPDDSFALAYEFTPEECLATFSTDNRNVSQICQDANMSLFLEDDGVTGYCGKQDPEHQGCGNLAHGDTTVRTMYLENQVPAGSVCVSEEQTGTCNDGVLEFTGSYTYSNCELDTGELSAVSIENKGTYFAVTIDYTSEKSRWDIGKEYGEKIMAIYPDFEASVDGLLNDVFSRGPWAPLEIKIGHIREGLRQEYRDELEGLASVFSGFGNVLGDGKLSIDEIFLLNFFTDMTESGCSAIAAFGEASVTGGTLIGRQVDWPEGGNRPLSRMSTVVTMKQGDKSMIGITFLGFLGTLTGISNDNVFASSIYSETGISYPSEGTSSYAFDMRYGLENYNTAEDVARYMIDPIRTYSFDMNIFVADETEAMVVESNLGGEGSNVRRDIRYHDSVIRDENLWDTPYTLGVVDSFLLEGNLDNHSNSPSNINRLASIKSQLSLQLEKGPLNLDSIKPISTYFTGIQPRDSSYGDVYNTWTLQIMLFDMVNHELKVFFKHPSTGIAADPEFIPIPLEF